MRLHHNSCLYTIVSLVLLITSCVETEREPVNVISPSVETKSMPAGLKDKGFDVTQEMAELFIGSNLENGKISSIQPYQCDGLTCFYIFNLDKGFKVVSADTRIQPILAESDEGHLYLEDNDNPGIKVWLEDTADRIKMVKTCNPDTKEDYSKLWSAYRLPDAVHRYNASEIDVDSVWVLVANTSIENVYNNADVAPLLNTRWGQGNPWYKKMPKINNSSCATGCVAVAISQVLYYYNRLNGYPNDLWHSISIQSTSTGCGYHSGCRQVTLNKSNHTINSTRWSQMPLIKTGSNTDYVSYLMLDIGQRLGMHYGTTGSVVIPNSDGSIPYLSSCGISSSFSSYSFSSVKNSILLSKPVIVGAFPQSNGVHAGHVWVIDGCHDYSKRYVTTVSYKCIHPEELINYPNNSGVISYDEMIRLYPDAMGGEYVISQSISYDNQQSLHMNWGGDGSGDAWYNMLDSDNWTVTSGGYTYNYIHRRVIHHNISASQLY